MNCKFCNAQIPLNKTICPVCEKNNIDIISINTEDGTTSSVPSKSPSGKTPAVKSSKGLTLALIFSIIFLTISVICLCFLIFFSNKTEDDTSSKKAISASSKSENKFGFGFNALSEKQEEDVSPEEDDPANTNGETQESLAEDKESKANELYDYLISNQSESAIEDYISSFIRPLYSDINTYIDNFSVSRVNPEITIWYSDTIVKMIALPGANNYDFAREYYYDEKGSLAFVYMYKNSDEHRLYFKNDKFIRYIDNAKNTYNNPSSAPSLKMAAFALEEAYTYPDFHVEESIVTEEYIQEFPRKITYSPGYTYKNMTQIHSATLAPDKECYELAEFVTKYNTLWIDYINYGNSSIFAYLRPGMQAYKYAENYSKKQITEEYKLLEINDVRKLGSTYYVWTHEIIEEINASFQTTTHEYNWIYRIGKDESGYYVENYISDPYYK